MTLYNNKPYLWQSNTNPELDLHERVQRRIKTHKEAIKYNWPITRSLYRLNTIKRNLVEGIEHLQNNKVQTRKKIMIKNII
jgi:hypothetical protein